MRQGDEPLIRWPHIMHDFPFYVGYAIVLALILDSILGPQSLRQASRGLLAGIVGTAFIFAVLTFIMVFQERLPSLLHRDIFGAVGLVLLILLGPLALSGLVGSLIWLWLTRIGRRGVIDAALLGLLLTCVTWLAYIASYAFARGTLRSEVEDELFWRWLLIAATAGAGGGLLAWRVTYRPWPSTSGH
jgi:hypothetical protein